MQEQYNPAFETHQTNYLKDFSNFKICNTLGLVLQTDKNVKCVSDYCVREAGAEIIISADDNALYRYNLYKKLDEEELEKYIKEHILNGIKNALSL